MRKLGWIRRDNLRYEKNIRDMAEAAVELELAGFIDTTLNDLTDAAKLLSKDELRDILKERRVTVPVDSPVSWN
jgi:hypothetical protein